MERCLTTPRSFAVGIQAPPENGVETTRWELAHRVTSASVRRVRPAPSRITGDQLSRRRTRIIAAVGIT